MKHIKIIDSKKCSGCGACSSICPKQCIKMTEDSIGCVYPHVDTKDCIKCGACVKVCPFLNPYKGLEPLKCFAAVNTNTQERVQSSSGGVFIALAKDIIAHGGIVFGAAFDADWNVRQVAAENMDDIEPLMRSKYVQSNIGKTFLEVREHLQSGRKVMYCGTPCQIAGLNHFLNKEHQNLLTVEVVCHGVPVPKAWKDYITESTRNPQADNTLQIYTSESDTKNKYGIKSISFRDKQSGWKKYLFVLHLASDHNSEKNAVSPFICQNFKENIYMKGFLNNWSLRTSCFACQAKSGRSDADLTIGDFWGVENYKGLPDDDLGTSCVICRTSKGLGAIEAATNLSLTRTDYDAILRGNHSIEQSVKYTIEARYFHRLLPKKGFHNAMYSVTNPPFGFKTLKLIKRIFKKLRKTLSR